MPHQNHSLRQALADGIFLVVGHRGLPHDSRENTLASFQAAIDAGANMIECDVQLTRNGVPVILHDETLERLWQDPRKLAEIDYDSIRETGIPSLEELCVFLSQNNCFLYLEMKSYTDIPASKFVQAVVPVLENYALLPRVVLVSFDTLLIFQAKKQYPELLVGCNICYAYELDQVVEFQRKKVNFLCPAKELVNRERLKYWHELGFAVVPFTVNNPEKMKQLRQLGVDGLTTDFAALLDVELS